MENLPFLSMQKGLNASTADLYLLPRSAGWICKRKRGNGFSQPVQAYVVGSEKMSKSAFDDRRHL
jgi:hypothetical protein